MEDEIDLDSMTPEERAEFCKMAEGVVRQVKKALLGSSVECPNCNVMVTIDRSHDHLAWSAECRCGWSAAGSGPPALKH